MLQPGLAERVLVLVSPFRRIPLLPDQRMMLMGLKRFTKIDPYNLKNARRKVADYIIEKGEYVF